LRWSIGLAVGPKGIGEPRLSEVWQAYLDAYQRLRPLTPQELAAIPHLVAIRHIRVMGWEVDRAVNGIGGVGMLTDDFFDWWFGLLDSWRRENC
jgi:Ser/Thr protein kinase RdoA (MazF antagonist)